MKKTVFLLATGMFILTGCPKHEIIPAPTKKVELTGHLEGNINGTDIELTEGVDSYSVSPTRALFQLPSPTPSKAIYYSEMKSSASLVSVKIGVGSLLYDASVSSVPTLTQFTNFFQNLLTTDPVYADGGDGGFEVVYRDGTGTVWRTRDIDPGLVHFSSVEQESDETADYMKFNMNFSCNVYRYTTAVIPMTNPVQYDTTWYDLPLTNVNYEGYFTR